MITQTALRTAALEAEGIIALRDTLESAAFSELVEFLLATKGRLVISGVGKSGHIARKISATLASTGTPSMFIHPVEASHGDMGMIAPDDVVLMLSNSGETKELEDIIAYCARFGIPMIGVVRSAGSMLAESANFPFVLPDIPEAGAAPAPTTSTTMMLVWGDALAMALAERKGFDKEDFGALHPGGKLGSRLKKLKDLMLSGDHLPLVSEDLLMADVLIIMSRKSFGCAIVTDEAGALTGLITDGDLRRHMCADLVSKKAADIMHAEPTFAQADMLAAEALKIMNDRKFTVLPICNENGVPVGIVHMQTLLSAGVY